MGIEKNFYKDNYNLQIRKDTESNWDSRNPVLLDGEIGLNTTTGDIKIGDGIKSWVKLDYIASSLNNLIDVIITDITGGEILKWNGAAWVNNTLTEAGLATAAQGTLADSALQPNGDGSGLTGIATAAQGALADNSVQLTGETSQTIEGNIGLNILTPTATLHVNGDSASTAIFRGATQSTVNLVAGSTNNYLVGTTGGNFSFRPNGNTSTTMLGNGNVGIGIPLPARRFHVFGVGGVAQFESSSNSVFSQYQNSAGISGYIGSGLGLAVGGVSTDFCIRSQSALLFTSGGNPERMRITSAGNLAIGQTTATEKVDVNGNVKATGYKVSALNVAPATATSTGITGDIRYTSDFIYVCVATNTWKRTAISTW
tara:strand:+ start:189 stop:1301 length:1113 start_codon:yes stop_codon:yes gene_type:complete